MALNIVFNEVKNHIAGKQPYIEFSYMEGTDEEPKNKKLYKGLDPQAFDAVGRASKGDKLGVELKKDDKGYWRWDHVSNYTQGETAPMQSSARSASAPAGSPARGVKYQPRGNYETPEERHARQIMIVRQSSLAQAVAYFSSPDKAAGTIEHILSTAAEFERWVLRD